MKFRQVTSLLEAEYTGTKIVVLCGTLSESKESSTAKAVDFVVPMLEASGASVKVVHLKDLDLTPGVTLTDSDDSKSLFNDVDEADIVIMASPIWWGAPSSLIQQVIEKFDAVDEMRRSAKPPKCIWYGKVFGCVIVGSEDGFQACSARLYSWAAGMGFTIPPDACVSVVGEIDELLKESSLKKSAQQFSNNMLAWSQMLRDNKEMLDTIQVGSIGVFRVSSTQK